MGVSATADRLAEVGEAAELASAATGVAATANGSKAPQKSIDLACINKKNRWQAEACLGGEK